MTRPKPVLLISILLGACATDPQIGAAVTNNIAAQTVDLNPQYAGVPMEGSNGERSVNAYRRYLKGVVAPLVKAEAQKAIPTMAGGAPQQ